MNRKLAVGIGALAVLGLVALAVRAAPFNGVPDNQTAASGYYYAITGGKFPNGSTTNGSGGGGGAFRYLTDDPTGTDPIDVWIKDNTWFSDNSGLTLTLRNGTNIVYDNNGLENATYGDYYRETGTHTDHGLYTAFTMSNNFDFIYAGYFKLTTNTTVTKITGYFDGNGPPNQPFDPSDPTVQFRMNIWSQTNGGLPVNTGGFSGDVLSSDTTPGVFGTSDTGVVRQFANTNTTNDPIYRLDYTLAAPVVLAAGTYWFSHDVAILQTQSLIWKGTTDNNWDLSSTNWASPARYFQNYTNAVLDDSGTNTAINLSVVATPLSLTVNNSLVNYSISGTGSINDETSLVKKGVGTLTLNNSNGYFGGTTILGGTVVVNHSNALGPPATAGPVLLLDTTGSGNASLLAGSAVTIAQAITVRGGATGTATLGGLNTSGTAIFSGTLTLNNALTLTAATNGTVDFQGLLNNSSPGSTISKIGAGTVIVSGTQNHAAGSVLNVTAGLMRLNSDAGGPAGSAPNLSIFTAASGTQLRFGVTQHLALLNVGTNTTVSIDTNGSRVIVTQSLALAGSGSNNPAGKINLHNNDLVITPAPGTPGNLLAVRAAIKAGRAAGDWSGQGIVTDMSAAVAGKTTTLGYAAGNDTNATINNSNGTGGAINGQSYGPGAVVVKYTYVGDANLDGSVDGLDIGLWANNFTGALGLGPTADPAKVWTQGDWNFDGSVDGLDAAIWATNFTGALGGGGLSGMVIDAPGANPAAVAILEGMGITAPGVAVPEPASLALLGLSGLVMLGGRRKRKRA